MIIEIKINQVWLRNLMSERSGSPCSDRNFPPKKKKIVKHKYEQSEKISESGQSKLTSFFKNAPKKQKPDPNPIHKTMAVLEAELESLKQQEQNLLFEKQRLVQQQFQTKHEHKNWMKRSKCLIQECLAQLYDNIRAQKGEIDVEKGYYDNGCRDFVHGGYGQRIEEKRNKLELAVINAEYSTPEELQMLKQFVQIQESNLERCRQQLKLYKDRLRNSFDEKTCKFSNSWPLLAQRYQTLQLLGKGGFSQVYKAYDLQQNRYVAVKKTSTAELNSQISHYIVREYENHLKLNHPNIAKLYQVIEATENTVCIALEYCEGPELAAYIRSHGRLPEPKAKYIMKQILSALKYLSSLEPKIIHYDLKPQNVIFSNGVIKILDFGLSKQIDSEHSRIELSNMGVGTYWYLPPESFNEKSPEISEKVDMWSAGVILYEMLTGRRPFGHNKSQNSIIKQGTILYASSVQFPDDVEMSENAKSLIRHCLCYDPRQRYTAAQGLAHAFFR